MFRPRSASRELQRPRDIVGRSRDVVLRQRHDFGPRGRPRGVQDQRDVARGWREPGRAAAPCRPPESVKLAAPAFASGVRVRTAIPSFFAASTAGGAARFDDERLGAEIAHVKFKFVGAIAGVERRGDGARCDRDKAVAISGPFGRTIATRSPRPTPKPFSAAIVFATSAFKPS